MNDNLFRTILKTHDNNSPVRQGGTYTYNTNIPPIYTPIPPIYPTLPIPQDRC